MTQNEKLGFEHKGIGELLAHNRMVVPLNQREYSWKDEHVHDLFTDFSNAIAKNVTLNGNINEQYPPPIAYTPKNAPTEIKNNIQYIPFDFFAVSIF